MKKIILFVFFLFCFSFYRSVYAVSFFDFVSLNQSDVSFMTDEFQYQKISYQTKKFNEKYDKIYFDAVKNQTDKELPFSVSILLFDENRINIGFISYCSIRELNGDYALLKIKAGSYSKFEIPLKNDYFVTGKSVSDLRYYSFLDSNIDCRKYDANKYEGLTIEDIKIGKVSSNYHEKSSFLLEIIENNKHVFLWILLGAIVVYLLISILTNYLYKKMFLEGNAFSFVPGIHFCLIVALSFGPIVGIIYSILLIVSIVLIFVINSRIMFYILLGVTLLSFIINIIKLICKKYGILYFDPIVHADDNPIYQWKNKPVKKLSKKEYDMQNTILDLGYHGEVITQEKDLSNNDGFSIDSLNLDNVVDEKNIGHIPDSNHDNTIQNTDIQMNSQMDDSVKEGSQEDEREEFMRMFR